jgi:hypothetical protein
MLKEPFFKPKEEVDKGKFLLDLNFLGEKILYKIKTSRYVHFDNFLEDLY